MAEAGPVVADSGPLIALATVRQMGLVGKLYGAVLVPGAVLREVTSFGRNRPGATELAAAAGAVRIELDPPPDPLLAEDTGPGEAEAITLAVRRGVLVEYLKTSSYLPPSSSSWGASPRERPRRSATCPVRSSSSPPARWASPSCSSTRRS